MKKHIIALLIALCCIASSLAVDAAEVSNPDNKFNENLKDDLIKNLDAKDKEILFDYKYFDESMQGLDLLNNPVIKCYTEPLWGEFGDGLKSAISQGENGIMEPYYVVFDTQAYKVDRRTDNGITSVGLSKTYSELPVYLKDIQLMDSEIEINRSKCTVENIVCFDMSHSFFGIVVYLVTDKGNVVKYYEYETSDAMVFSEEEFKTHAKKYNDFLISPENNYDENGNYVGGSGVTFAGYVRNNPINSSENNSNQTDESYLNNANNPATSEKNHRDIVYVIGATGIVLVSSIAAILWRKKKKC